MELEMKPLGTVLRGKSTTPFVGRTLETVATDSDVVLSRG